VHREEQAARRARILEQLAEAPTLDSPETPDRRAVEARTAPDPTAGTPRPSQSPRDVPDALRGVLKGEPEPFITIPLPEHPQDLPDEEPVADDLEAIEAEPEDDEQDEQIVEAVRELLGVSSLKLRGPEPEPVSTDQLLADLREALQADAEPDPEPEMPLPAVAIRAEAAKTPGPIPEVPPAAPEPPEALPEGGKDLSRVCLHCELELPLERFRPNGSRAGLRSVCRDCENVRKREIRAERRTGKRAAPRPKPVLHKACTRCATDKPLAEFRTDKRRPDGHTTLCTECIRARERAWDAKRKELALAAQSLVKCTKCGEMKNPKEDFYRRALKKEGRATQCKECEKAYARAHKKRRIVSDRGSE
jgi:hypothetical protein